MSQTDFLEQIRQKGKEATSESAPESPIDEAPYSPESITLNRQHAIQEAAYINCSLLEDQLQQCMKHGSLLDRATMCWSVRNMYWDCVKAQKEFLAKHGYASVRNSAQDDARILNEADLFQIQREKEEKNSQNSSSQ